ncbi:MAG TPA: S-adenosylmethionine:tRNA ribosyltransferase-isomerase, partial [Herpetosiphonaceae bacterium]
METMTMFPPQNAASRTRPIRQAPRLGENLEFELPAALEAGEPPEARGLARDQVRLMVSRYGSDEIVHTRFRQLPEALRPGDLLVLNTSGTLNAALV